MPYETLDSIIEALEQFEPARDETENLCRLYDIFRNFESMSGRDRALPSMFGLLERFPDGEFGTPGPLVQRIEDVEGYAAHLTASLARRPTWYAVWMVNRIMNATTDEPVWRSWMAELQKAQSHPLSDEYIRERAREFAGLQSGRLEK